jgi:filamentous hemagglutinin family protein
MEKRLAVEILILPCFFVWFSCPNVVAQVIPDNSLGNESSTVTPDVAIKEKLVDLIKGGAARGDNLFHSFAEFQIPDGKSVYFTNPDGIANIITRITGNNISEILGTLGVNGNANLFLVNPNGIIFGENASLDIAGSFLVTTADRLIFKNGFEFSASNPQAPPLLTINLPIGLQFGAKAESIVNRSQALDSQGFKVGLQVQPQQNITLVGGNIFLEAGKITAPFGRVELGSVGPGSLVALEPDAKSWKLNFDRANNFQDLVFSQGAFVSTRGTGGGEVFVRGKRLILAEGSDIFAETLGDDDGGIIRINTSESVELFGGPVEGQFFAYLDASTYGKGKGGNIEIFTGRLRLIGGARILASTYAQGNSGNVRIEADAIEMSGVTANGRSASRIASDARKEATGRGGNITIETRNLTLRNGAQIGSGTFGQGDAGSLKILATESIDLAGIISRTKEDGSGEEQFSSGLFAGVEPGAKGKGSIMSIETNRLRLAEGARVTTSTFGEGDAGDLNIIAKDIEVNGIIVDEINSFNGLLANVEKGAAGKGGNLTITTDRLRILNGGQVSASTFGNGNAGNVSITAKSLELSGISPDGKFASSLAAVSTTAFDAGFLNLKTDRVRVSDGAQITVSSNDPSAGAGNLELQANSIFLDKSGSLSAEVNTGDRGNINIDTGYLELRQGSKITTNAIGTADGGNISIESDNLVLFDDSLIAANSLNNFGGRVIVNTKGLFQSSASQITASSELGAFFDGIVETNSLEVDPQSLAVGLPEKTIQPEQKVVASCSTGQDYSLVVSGRGGIPENPIQTIRDNTVWWDLRPFSQKSIAHQNSNTTINNTELKFNNYSRPIEAQTLTTNKKGNLELVASKGRDNWHKIPSCSIVY